MRKEIGKAIKELIKEGKKEFVIYPFGKYGKLAKEILNEEFGIKERYIVDNFLSEVNEEIYDINYMKKDYESSNSNFIILLAVDPQGWNISLEIHRQISFVAVERIADILARSTYFCPWNHYESIKTLKWPKIALIECLSREIYKNGVKGAVAEAGVFQGQTARFINTFFPDRKLYLFDTFEGFNKFDQINDDKRNLYNEKIDYSETSEELVLQRMHFPQNCVIKKGWFPESTEDVKEVFAFVRLDMDLYNPIYSGLEFFYPRMQPGGYIVVHDCRSKNFEGARKALIDFCTEKKIGYMCMSDNLGSAVINIGF